LEIAGNVRFIFLQVIGPRCSMLSKAMVDQEISTSGSACGLGALYSICWGCKYRGSGVREAGGFRAAIPKAIEVIGNQDSTLYRNASIRWGPIFHASSGAGGLQLPGRGDTKVLEE
jgi:hypothetical protein